MNYTDVNKLRLRVVSMVVAASCTVAATYAAVDAYTINYNETLVKTVVEVTQDNKQLKATNSKNASFQQWYKSELSKNKLLQAKVDKLIEENTELVNANVLRKDYRTELEETKAKLTKAQQTIKIKDNALDGLQAVIIKYEGELQKKPKEVIKTVYKAPVAEGKWQVNARTGVISLKVNSGGIGTLWVRPLESGNKWIVRYSRSHNANSNESCTYKGGYAVGIDGKRYQMNYQPAFNYLHTSTLQKGNTLRCSGVNISLKGITSAINLL